MTAPTTTTTRRAPAPTDADGALSFEPAPRQDKMANITIEVGPQGITVRAEYTGPLGSIPRSIQRLKEEGILELVRAHAVAPAAPGNGAKKPAVPKVQPIYDGGGAALCPAHRKRLVEGQYGLYCPSTAKGDEAANGKGYCALRFEE